MPIDVVYAKINASLSMPSGHTVAVHVGTHWPATDPVVRQHPDAFTADPRFGMSWTGETPYYMNLPPDVPIDSPVPAAPSGPTPPTPEFKTVEQATSGPGERRAVRRHG